MAERSVSCFFPIISFVLTSNCDVLLRFLLLWFRFTSPNRRSCFCCKSRNKSGTPACLKIIFLILWVPDFPSGFIKISPVQCVFVYILFAIVYDSLHSYLTYRLPATVDPAARWAEALITGYHTFLLLQYIIKQKTRWRKESASGL